MGLDRVDLPLSGKTRRRIMQGALKGEKKLLHICVTIVHLLSSIL